MERDTFSHIRLWCPRPFASFSQSTTKARAAAGGGGGGGGDGGGPGPPSLCKADPPAAGGRCSLGDREEGGGEGAMMVLGGMEEENDGVRDEEEEEEAGGSENTPPRGSAAPPSDAPSPPPSPPPSSGAQVEDGRVLLDTWYVIKPGNTREKIAFFVAHQFSGAGATRPSAMKVKGNWATDCSKAKRRRRCSSYDPPARSSDPRPHDPSPDPAVGPPSPEEPSPSDGAGETDLLSVAEMVALVEQRTAMALQEMVALQGHPGPDSTAPPLQHTLLRGTASDPMAFLSESGSHPRPPTPPLTPRPSSPTDLELEDDDDDDEEEEEEEEEEGSEQQESRRVAQAIAHFESQNLEGTVRGGAELGKDEAGGGGGGSSSRPPPPPPTHGRGEVRIAFRVSSLDPRSQSEPAGRPRCMFISCGGGGGQGGARAKEKITCDLYQLVSPSSRDPSGLLLAGAGSPKADHHQDRPVCRSPDPGQEPPPGEKQGGGRERMTGFHVEVVVTGAVDQCVFYGKDSTENVQEETVCFALPGAAGGATAGGGSSTELSSDDPPPGQLFFLQSPRVADDDGASPGNGGVMCSLDCANNNNGGRGGVPGGDSGRPDSPLAHAVRGGGGGTDDGGPAESLCRLYRHVSHDFLEIRFQIQRLLEPRQYMLLLPDHVAVAIFSHLPTRALAALKCTCHAFRALIEAYGVRATDALWTRDPLYRDDPCKQCKRRYARGDVSLCRWHPKPYHHDLPYGRSYWMCCRRADKDAPGCRLGLHDNNWVQPPPAATPPPRAKREDAG